MIYGKRTISSPCSLLMIQNDERGTLVETPMVYPCDHVESNSGLFTVEREGKERLLVSCFQCRYIKLLDTGTMQVEFETKLSKHYKFDVFCLWPGPSNTAFVASKNGDIWHLDSSFKLPKNSKKFNCGLGYCESVSFLPDPQGALIVRHKCKIKAVTLLKQEELWTKNYRQNLPNDLFFSSGNNSLFSTDQKKPQIHVLDPSDGKVCQTIGIPNAEVILSMCLYKGQISMVQRSEQGSDGNMILSHYSLALKSQDTESSSQV